MNKLDLNSLKWRKKRLEKKNKTYSTLCVMKSLMLLNKTLLISLTLIMPQWKNLRRAKRKKKKLRKYISQQSHSTKPRMKSGHNLIIHIQFQKSWKKLLLKKLLRKFRFLHLHQKQNNQLKLLRYIHRL